MKVGILEERDDSFARDVASSISDLDVHFIRLGELPVPGKSDFKVILDRQSFNRPFLREAMKAFSLNGTYVINNPFTSQLFNKNVDMNICQSLGIPHPKTIILPMMEEVEDHSVTEPDIDSILRQIDLPCVLKPYDGYAWENVYVVTTKSEFRNLYDSLKFRRVMLAQQYIERKHYYRVFCVNKEKMLFSEHVPKPLCQGAYLESDLKPLEGIIDRLREWSIKLNTELDLDLNALEWCIDTDGNPFLIDAFNEVPEVLKHNMPESQYSWLVSKVSECIREKAGKEEINRNPFNTSGRT
ncbi:MAG: hypothetical protein JW754_06125 [Candidatus Aenigmarchaeota archaeon]|nr:hypothetical protein [Candidatus Aenigmarchaeota archaeon]